MNKNAWIACLGGTVVALGAAVVMQSRQMEALKKAHACELAALSEKLEVTAKAVRAGKQRAKEAAAVQQVERAAPPAQPAKAEPPAPSAQQAAGMNTNFFGAIAGMMKNPQMKEMMKAQQKLAVDQMYASLPRYLGLPAETKEKLQALLLERHLAMAESGLAMMGGSQEARAKAMEDTQAAKAEYDQAIKELLGDADYEIFAQYEKSLPEQTHVTMFKNTLTGDESLSEQQENDLVAALYQARKELPSDSLLNQQGQSPDPAQFSEERVAETLKQMELLQERYAEGAAGILNSAQMERFKQWQQQMAAMQRAGLSMAAQMFGQGKAGGGASK